jgi:hypothetical protein
MNPGLRADSDWEQSVVATAGWVNGVFRLRGESFFLQPTVPPGPPKPAPWLEQASPTCPGQVPAVTSKAHACPDLRGEGNADSGARTKEVSQSAGWDGQLLQVGDGFGGGAGRIGADRGHVARLLIYQRNRKRSDVAYEVGSRIVAVEEVEELDERNHRPAVVEIKRPADSQVGLDVWRPPELVQAGGYTIYRNAGAVVRGGNGDGTGTFSLGQSCNLDSAGDVESAG